MDDQAAVLAANREFYRAFAAADLAGMDAVWANAASVTCVHPGWDALSGRGQVMESWRAILLGPAPPPIRCDGETAYVHGDTAYVICHEVIERNRLVAINLFARLGGAWKMVHHQASPMAAPQAPRGPAAPQRLH
ncbi:MAG: nuclear transport factor 2 family protein [Alphaproteobacteria bacterium]|nr:nuclear transport factor 2 family protein [Alphaproteobacteria bacterium]